MPTMQCAGTTSHGSHIGGAAFHTGLGLAAGTRVGVANGAARATGGIKGRERSNAAWNGIKSVVIVTAPDAENNQSQQVLVSIESGINSVIRLRSVTVCDMAAK